MYPVEFDKCQVIEHVSNEHNEIYYFGNNYQENGNNTYVLKFIIGVYLYGQGKGCLFAFRK